MGSAATARLTRRLFTPEEYLTIERAAEYRSEYREGEIFAMAGGSFTHSAIGANVLVALSRRVASSGCRCVGPDMRVGVSSSGAFYYPDISVVCGEPRTVGGDILMNPVLVVEVLSKSTAKFDREVKLADYMSMPSMREVLLVSQDRQRVEVHSRERGAWTVRVFTKSEGAISIPRFDCSIPFQEIYEGC